MESKKVTGTRITTERAIKAAADAVPATGLPAAAHLVERLDGKHAYFLVHFGGPGGRGAAVMVDAVDATIMARAAVEHVEQPWLLTQERALEIAAHAQPAEARLIWKPTRATRSPFYPLWEISTASKTLWVDQSEKVWLELTPPGPG